jgi:hypothetical protein
LDHFRGASRSGVGAQDIVDRGPRQARGSGNGGDLLAISLQAADGPDLPGGDLDSATLLAAAPALAIGSGDGLAGTDTLGSDLVLV